MEDTSSSQQMEREEETAGQGPGGVDSAQNTMALTRAERDRALQIKAEVEASDHLDNLSDFEYAHYALSLGSEPMDKIFSRIYKMQCFRREYQINDTVEEGVCLMRELMLKQPGYILSVDFSPKYGTYIIILDMAVVDPSRFNTTIEELRVMMAGHYYLIKCVTANFQAIREGVVCISECDGMGSKNFDWQLTEKFSHEFMNNMPYRQKETVSGFIILLFHLLCTSLFLFPYIIFFIFF